MAARPPSGGPAPGPRQARAADDDAELVASAASGDADALERLLHRHHALVWSVCLRICGNPADAADASQEALVAIVRGLPRFDGRSRFSTWAYKVAANAALDELRRRRRRPRPVETGPGAGIPEPLSVIGRPESGAVRVDVAAALARVPDDFRAAVVLRDLAGLDYAEIAEVLGVPIGTVRSRIARGRAALASLLDDPTPDSPTPGSPGSTGPGNPGGGPGRPTSA